MTAIQDCPHCSFSHAPSNQAQTYSEIAFLLLIFFFQPRFRLVIGKIAKKRVKIILFYIYIDIAKSEVFIECLTWKSKKREDNNKGDWKQQQSLILKIWKNIEFHCTFGVFLNENIQ